MSAKSAEKLDELMQSVEPDSLRFHVLESAKGFKSSWIALGRSLYAVWKDKLYKSWGYSTFDIYTAKEIGIKKQTAVKLLRSYYFLEKEEPEYVKQEFVDSATAATVPSVESVDILRLAKSKKELPEEDYQALKREVFEKGKETSEVKKDLVNLLKSRVEQTHEEAWEEKRSAVTKRLVSTLVSLKKEIQLNKILSNSVIKDLDTLISRIQNEIE